MKTKNKYHEIWNKKLKKKKANLFNWRIFSYYMQFIKSN